MAPPMTAMTRHQRTSFLTKLQNRFRGFALGWRLLLACMCLRGACELNSAMKMKQDVSRERKKRAKILTDSRLFSNTVHC